MKTRGKSHSDIIIWETPVMMKNLILWFTIFLPFLFRPCSLLASLKSLILLVPGQNMVVHIRMNVEEGMYYKIRLTKLFWCLVLLFFFKKNSQQLSDPLQNYFLLSFKDLEMDFLIIVIDSYSFHSFETTDNNNLDVLSIVILY